MAFDLSALLRESAAEMQQETLRSISLDLIDEDERNFYSMDTQGIEALAENIELCGLMDPIRVRENGGRYTVVSGHRRRAACMKLRDEGNEKFKSVPCIVETAGSEAMQELRLIYANRNTRTLTSADIARQAERVTELLYKLKEEGMEFPGRMVDHVAQACNVSASKLKRLNAIKNNLSAEFYACFQGGTLNETAAYAISRLPREIQEHLARKQKVLNLAQKKDGISSLRVEDCIKNAEKLNSFKHCLKDHETCQHSLERYAASIANNSYWSCSGNCCCTCGHLDSCPYPCKHGKTQLAAQKAEEKAEKDARAAKAEEERSYKNNLRRIRQLQQVCRLAELCDRAGIPDDEQLHSKSWLRITAGAVRELAEDGFDTSANFYDDDYCLLCGSLSDLQKLAEQLKCTVGELAGEEIAVSIADTGWRTGTPTVTGSIFGKFDCAGTVIKSPAFYDKISKDAYFKRGGQKIDAKLIAWVPLPED